MIRKIKNIIANLLYADFLQYATDPPSNDTLIRIGLRQRLYGNHRKIKWPVHHTSMIKAAEKINPGTRSPGLSPRCWIDGRNGIKFGKNVWIGPDVKIISQNHDMLDYTNYVKACSIVIGHNVWIGAGSIILPEVELADHIIVGAGAVVTKSFTEPDCIIGGVPAKVIKKINTYRVKG